MLFAAFCVLAFLAAGAVDYLETRYVRAVQEKASTRAAVCSVGMMILGVAGFYGILEVSPWLLIPECLGMFVGTKLAMR